METEQGSYTLNKETMVNIWQHKCVVEKYKIFIENYFKAVTTPIVLEVFGFTRSVILISTGSYTKPRKSNFQRYQ